MSKFVDGPLTPISSLESYYDCLGKLHSYFNMRNSTKWYVTSDTADVYAHPATLRQPRGKVKLLHSF